MGYVCNIAGKNYSCFEKWGGNALIRIGLPYFDLGLFPDLKSKIFV